ncbi:rhodanese-like domain-containing protein [Alicyclobacillus macrosporangiidus]|uniref:Rhodanese-related sulfurtransferase n=1 Tax=Alicyclobacillus macrosporangiidus TaxID=392015 RepID=A0A1I7KLL3_9BACL|nr:rhodanese-like domain-containing protein [Alicyclobacillus macrosporangiidus]SFU98337.1 Rhodanese-related sulfurtransferase [Alicyclobacillus macrosporangiidus]
MPFERDGIVQYSVDELKEILRTGTAQVIDVRTEEEYRNGHIPNVPLKPMQQLAEWMDDLDPEKPYVFVCRSGNRSQKVAEFLFLNGFRRVANFDGGMLAWDGDLAYEE